MENIVSKKRQFTYFLAYDVCAHLCACKCICFMLNKWLKYSFSSFTKTMKEVVRSRTPMKEVTTVEIWTHPHPQV